MLTGGKECKRLDQSPSEVYSGQNRSEMGEVYSHYADVFCAVGEAAIIPQTAALPDLPHQPRPAVALHLGGGHPGR